MAMAIEDSVTVSIGEEMSGVFSVIFLVNAEVMSYIKYHRNDKKNNNNSVNKTIMSSCLTSGQKWVYFDYVVPCLANRGRRVSITAVPIILTGILCLVVKIVWLKTTVFGAKKNTTVQKPEETLNMYSARTHSIDQKWQ